MQKLFGILALTASCLFGSCAKECCDPCGCDPCTCDPCPTCNDVCDPCDTCCCDPCCCEPCDFTPPCPPETCAYNAPVFRDIKCGWDIFVTASFLYFQAKEENLHFYVLEEFDENSNVIETVYPMCFDYEPAFKVGLGMNFNCDGWAFYVEYLRYHATAGSGSLSRDSAPNNGNMRLETLQVDNNFTNNTSLNNFTSSSSWRLEADIVDASLSRQFYVGQCFTMTVSGGLRAAWIDQKPSGKIDGQDTSDEVVSSNFKNDVCSWGVGPRYAIDANWIFCSGFYLYNNFSYSILYTEYDDINHQENITEYYYGDTKRTSDKTLCFLRPQVDLGIGIGWGDYFCCNDWYFDLKIGYETRVLWNQNTMPLYVDNDPLPSDNNGDLYLHGLVITARLDF